MQARLGVATAALLLCVTSLSACAHNAREGGGATPSPSFTFSTPAPQATWPSYAAEDYAAKRPALKPNQIALIRKTLGLIKPCQRQYLRYAFPQNESAFPFVLFFEQPSVSGVHVLWSNNLFFESVEGNVVAGNHGGPPMQNIQYDIDHFKCEQ